MTGGGGYRGGLDFPTSAGGVAQHVMTMCRESTSIVSQRLVGWCEDARGLPMQGRGRGLQALIRVGLMLGVRF